MDYAQLYDAVKSGEITAAVTIDGRRDRFFISGLDNLCRYAPRSSRRGYPLSVYDIERYQKFVSPAAPSDEERLKKEYRVIHKYKQMASKASFTNPFIRDCLALPDYDDWLRDVRPDDYWDEAKRGTPKSVYDYHVTTGNRIDGKVISLDRISRKYPREIERFRECVRNRTSAALLGGMYNGWQRAKFDGYDISLEAKSHPDGDFTGYLSLEYAGCGNGYYYLLINDDNFIGYDID